MTKKHFLIGLFIFGSQYSYSIDLKDDKNTIVCSISEHKDKKNTLLLNCPEVFRVQSFDAIMPAHKHGMNVKPEIKKIDEKTAEIYPIILHMPGSWQYVAKITIKEKELSLTSSEFMVHIEQKKLEQQKKS